MFRSLRTLLAVPACAAAVLAIAVAPAFAEADFQPLRPAQLGNGANTRYLPTSWPLASFRADGTFDFAAAGFAQHFSRPVVNTATHAPATVTGAGNFVRSGSRDDSPFCTYCDDVSFAQNSHGDAIMSYRRSDEVWVRRRTAGGAWSEELRVSDNSYYANPGPYASFNYAFAGRAFVTERNDDGVARFVVSYNLYSDMMNPDGGSSEDLAVLAVATGEDGAFSREPIGEFTPTAESSRVQALVPDENGDPVVLFNQEYTGGAQTSLMIRKLGPDTMLDAPLQVNPSGTRLGNNTKVDAAVGRDGAMMVAWTAYPSATEYTDARRFAPDGTPGMVHRLPGQDFNSQPQVTALGDDAFAIAYMIHDGANDGHGQVRPVNVDWNPTDGWSDENGPEYLTDAGISYSISDSAMHAAATGDGTLIVEWNGVQTKGAGTSDDKKVWVVVREPGGEFLAEQHIADMSNFQNTVQVVADRGGNDAAVLVTHYATVTGDNGQSYPNTNVMDVIPFDGEGPRGENVSVAAAAITGVATQFDASDVTDTWSQVTDVEWFIGAQSLGSGLTRSHTFSAAGTFTVTAVLTDAAGNSTNVNRTITVVGAAAPPTNTGGGTQQQQTPVTNEPPKPTFTLTSTVSTDKMPALVGLKVDAARDRLDRVGIQADLNVVLVHQATAPRGITVGEVMTQLPAANTAVTSAIRDAEPVTLRVYAGPANKSVPTKKRCSTVNLSKALKGVDLDMATIIARSMACDVEVDVKVGGSADPAVTGVMLKNGQIVLAANAPKAIASNDLFLVVRESTTGNNISFNVDDWSLTANQRNAFTVQVVDRAFRLVRGAKLTYDVSAVGSVENLEGTTNANGEQTTTVVPTKGGTIDVLAQLTGADGRTLYGTAQLKVASRSSVKNGTKLYTTIGRTFVKGVNGYAFASNTKLAKPGDHPAGAPGFGARATDAIRSYASAKSENWWDRFCNWLGDITKGTGKDEAAFQKQGGQSAQQTIQSGIKKTGLAPAQLLLASPLLGANLAPGTQQNAPVVSAGGANVVAAGGGNVIAAGGANVVSAGGGNVVAAGGGNVISAGGGNVMVGSGVGVIAAGGGNVISAGGGNVISAGGGNVISAGGGNVIAAGGLN